MLRCSIIIIHKAVSITNNQFHCMKKISESRIMMNLLERQTSKFMPKLSHNDLQTLKKLNNQYEEIPQFLMKDLADQTYTSISTLHRLILKIGFKGFSDFKLRISDDIQRANKEVTNPFNDEVYLENYLNNIRLTKHLNEHEISRVAQVIIDKENLYCFGTGFKQKQVIDNFSNDLIYYGHSLLTLRTENDFRMASKNFDKESLIIIVSLSGDIETIKEIIDTCKLKDATVISVTSDTVNQLSALADYSLYYKENVLDNLDKHWNINTLNFLVNYLIESIIHQQVQP